MKLKCIERETNNNNNNTSTSNEITKVKVQSLDFVLDAGQGLEKLVY